MVNNEFSIAAHWLGGFDETGLRQWAENLRAQLLAPQVSLGLVFMSPKFFPFARQALEILRVHARIPLLAGCSSAGLIAGAEEIEEATGLVLALYSLPGAELKGFVSRRKRSRKPDGTRLLAPGDRPRTGAHERLACFH
jgi:small ligand-binding sensory domain FIST